MRLDLIAGVATLCCVFIATSSALSQDYVRPMTPAQKRDYHACLYAAYIDDYCRYNYQGSFSEQSFRECVIANRAGTSAFRYRTYWGFGAEDYCRAVVETRAR